MVKYFKVDQQTLKNKLGEVSFRSKLMSQHADSKIVFPGEPNYQENLVQIKTRVKVAEAIFQNLAKLGVRLSPFLEIAAGQGYRVLPLVNNFSATGIITDISAETLGSVKVIGSELNLAKFPFAICCDAENLPFASNSFPFVCIFLSLHHFPDPKLVIAEAARVLADEGHFYFDEEPVDQGLNLNWWRRDYHLTAIEKILKLFLILPFLSKIGKTEVEHGILEETFSLKTWEAALSPFEKVWLTLKAFPFGPQDTIEKAEQTGWLTPNLQTRAGLWLFGGGIKGLARISKKQKAKKFTNLHNFLICPDCRLSGSEITLEKQPRSRLFCPQCGRIFSKISGVLSLLPNKLEEKLYAKG